MASVLRLWNIPYKNEFCLLQVGVLDRHRVLSMFESFYDKQPDHIKQTMGIRNPRKCKSASLILFFLNGCFIYMCVLKSETAFIIGFGFGKSLLCSSVNAHNK